MAVIVHLNPKGCMGPETKCRRSAFEGAPLISRFSPDKARDIAGRAGLVSQAYPQLSRASKEFLLHPHIFPFFLGVKDAYIKYEGEPDTENFANEAVHVPEFRNNYPLVFTENYMVNITCFRRRMADMGHLISGPTGISQIDVDYLATGSLKDRWWITKLRDTLNAYIEPREERTVFHGFLMGYPMQDIEYCLGIERAEYPLDARIITNYFGNEMLSDHNKVSERLLTGWETAMKYGYALLSKFPDFWECFIPAIENAVSWLPPSRVINKPFRLPPDRNWN